MPGYLRLLYHALCECESGNEWEDVIKPMWPRLKETRAYYEEIKNRKCAKWAELTADELMNLYSVSRVSDFMLLGFQESREDIPSYQEPNISLANLIEFFEKIGFQQKHVAAYHPFHCEIAGVIEHGHPEIVIQEIKWPAFMLGNMMFSRAGVIVKAPKEKMTKGLADRSALYWSFLRKYRRAIDLSIGWGHNSQWKTRFRRDFDLGDRFAYNVDGHIKIVDLRLPLQETEDPMEGLGINDRIEFLRNRCLTTVKVDDSDLRPYDDYFEETV